MTRILPILLLLVSCTLVKKERENNSTFTKDAYPSTYVIPKQHPWLIKNATILTGAGERLDDASILIQDGKIVSLGAEITAPSDAVVLDGKGKWVTPGLIDIHSHMGVYAMPSIESHNDGNEITSPNTAEVWAEHSVSPEDPALEKALAGGVTTLLVLPGSANLFGGRGITLKNVRSLTVQGMKYPDAPSTLKIACGENPKRVYGSSKKSPATLMGNMAQMRMAFIKAQNYRREWNAFLEKKENPGPAPKRDLQLETLAGVLNGDILVHNHCYKTDEMAQMIDLSKEFGFKIAAFHHAVESYKIADLLKQENICSAMWADWGSFKLEAFDWIPENIAIVDRVGACAMIHSDSNTHTQRLNQEIAKSMVAGNNAGLNITRAQAIRWATLNPSKAMGLDNEIGSLEPRKNADVVLWDQDPFSVYALAEKVWIDGVLRYDRANPEINETSDFNLGILDPNGDRP